FWDTLGLRSVHQGDELAIFELRGGTHLILVPGTPDASGEAPFDLMVDDVDRAHEEFARAGMTVSPIERGEIHDAFTITDPDGVRLTVNSSHVVGPV
ncbi:MAG TPA: VOC family protein, partial [Acidimicrobiia bacterium]|nr:VOC family protein [Acidimicrobiia bacterium]